MTYTYGIRFGLILSLSVALFLWAAKETHACVCSPDSSPAWRLDRADSVFVGKVTSMTSFEIAPGSPRVFPDTIVTFEVQRIWKGVRYHEMHTLTALYNTCGYDFRLGNEYLVYVRNNETGVCDGTSHMRHVEDFLKNAARHSESATLESVYGLGIAYLPAYGTSQPRPSVPGMIDPLSPDANGCSAPSTTHADVTWLVAMAGLVWLSVRWRPRK